MRFLFLAILFFFSSLLNAQTYNYINYTVKDGLAGNTVYSMCQDKDGFMWFGTENGLSRYDGTHFKNFTIKDGLPDNEVIKVFADSKGRVWIGTFSKEVCYYYKGKICNRTNDTLIKKIQLKSNVDVFLESTPGQIVISTRNEIIILDNKSQLFVYNKDSIAGMKNIEIIEIIDCHLGFLRFARNYDVYKYDNLSHSWGKMNDRFPFPTKYSPFLAVIKLDTFRKKVFKVLCPDVVLNTFSGVASSHTAKYIGTQNGVWAVDTVNLKLGVHLLDNIPISHALDDKEKNIWFTSLGKGIYKVPSLSIKTLAENKGVNLKAEVFALSKHQKNLLAGTDYSRAILIDQYLQVRVNDYEKGMKKQAKIMGAHRLFSLSNLSDSISILGFDACIGKLTGNKIVFKYLNSPVKSVEKINEDYFIAGTATYAFRIRVKDLSITDTIWRERCTKVFYSNGNYYIGTLAGLYEVKEDKTDYYLGNLHPILTRRIMDIKKDASGVLWVSTSDKGVIGIKDRKIIRIIDDSNGLSSNNAKTLFLKGNYLWVGTNNGICKANIANNQSNEIIKYSMSDGLPSNNINALYIDDSLVWVGSPEGLTYFKEKDIASSSMCNLKLTDVTISGVTMPLDSSFKLSYKNNSIRFAFAGISFRSGGEIVYHYKLNGVDTDWKTTSDNFLDYKTLPPGDYKLELFAINKYGVKSETLVIPILVDAPFWKTLWFYSLAVLTIMGGLVYLFNRRNKIIQQKLEETNRQQKQFAELEQQALQSQMNPHFIFNCLNSIQQHILTRDTEKANLYLTEFAHLIRQTLNISAQKAIPLNDEMEYLTRYLNMEQMRFGNNFSYTIQTENITNTSAVEIPSLLIQPFVENSLRHGIRHLTNRQGKIEIHFSLNNRVLLCQVKDNGVGREQAEKFKSQLHIEYQSKGMGLTQKRINLLNTLSENKITLTVTDLKDDDNAATGTLVELNIPL